MYIYAVDPTDTFIFAFCRSELCPCVQKWKKDRGGKKIKIKGTKGRVQLTDLLQMQDDELEKMGIKNKIYRKRILAMSARITVRFSFLFFNTLLLPSMYGVIIAIY